MIVWIDRQLALTVHDRQIADYGGASGVRDDNMLESALARPQQLHTYGDPTPDLAELAASLAYGLAKNHPFVDGNKRTAYVCCESFIELNGGELAATLEEKYITILGLAEGRMSVEEYGRWLRKRIVMKSAGVQEPRATYKPKIRRRRAITKRAKK